MQSIIIENQQFEVVDIIEKITVADSFVVRQNKIGSGNGEAKLYVGQDNVFVRNFFGAKPFVNNCFLLKKDLLRYLQDTRQEYLSPEQPYVFSEQLPTLWHERFKHVSQETPDILNFLIQEQVQIAGPRVYVKSRDASYNLLRTLSIPNITYISILKLRRLNDGMIFLYFRPFADYFGEAEHPVTLINEESAIENEILDPQEAFQVRQSRKGHGRYREQLLDSCPFCPITMIADDRLLIASHIKPWVDSDQFEKTDPYNGFMLSPTFDKLFDRGFMTFTDDKRVVLSPFLSKMTYSKIGISDNKIFSLLPIEGRERYLDYHRNNIFKAVGDTLL
ncbi:HNH endonuclease [Psychrobacter cibarius]|uniref:HNH endonuclease n=2 Tax=Psychrobacter cibarius TaxID=282669 RepID=UPI003FD6057D